MKRAVRAWSTEIGSHDSTASLGLRISTRVVSATVPPGPPAPEREDDERCALHRTPCSAPSEGPPGKRIARPRELFHDHLLVWGYGTREIFTCAQQTIQTEEDGGVAARVNLEPLFDLKGGSVFAQVWSQPLLDSPHSASPSVLTRSILHTLPASSISVAGSTQRPSPKETMLATKRLRQ
jgi:hypothetical protein